MFVVLPKPKSITRDEVVLSRADWERFVSAFENSESDGDADDIAAVAAARAEDTAFAARLEAERGSPVETTIPIAVVKAELAGTHPIQAWRGYRGWTQTDLSAKSGITPELIDELETRRKDAGVTSLSRLAHALRVPIEVLIDDEGEDIIIGEPQ